VNSLQVRQTEDKFARIKLNGPESQITRLKSPEGDKMTASNIPKIKLRNSVTECGASVRKENTGKYQNYAIKDCIVSIAATKMNK